MGAVMKLVPHWHRDTRMTTDLRRALITVAPPNPRWPPGGHGVTLLMHPERERHRMITGPGDEMAAAGPGDIRASHADRERVIDTVKAAFARGQLTAGELDARVGQALTARTYAELAAVTLSIPARSDLARPAKPVPAKPVPAKPRRPRNRLVNRGACVIAATTLAAGVWVGIVAGAAAAVIVAMFMLNLAALATRPLHRSRPGPSRGRASRNAMKPRIQRVLTP